MPEFTGSTDEKHTFTLPSEIDSVRWDRRQAAPGGIVGLEVQTIFCADGSQIEIKLEDAQGTVHATLSGKLRGDRVGVDLKVPEKAKGGLLAKVKMPNHGLSAESEALKVVEPVQMRGARWSKERVQRGDIVTLSAEARGAQDGRRAIVRIFERDPDRGAHDPVTQLRPRVEDGAVEVMYQFQYPGDPSDIVPEWDAPNGYQQPKFFYTVETLGVTADSQKSKSKGVMTFVDDVTVELQDLVSGAPIEDEKVVVILPDGSEQSTTLDAEGRAELTDVPPGPVKYFFPDLPGSSRELPLIGSTGPEPNTATLGRIAPQQTILSFDHETGVLDRESGPPTPGNWIYVFAEHPDRDPPMTPIVEAKVMEDGSMKRVDWSEPAKWDGKDERSPSIEVPTAQGTPYLRLMATEALEKMHLMISPAQLTAKRLDAYRKDRDPHAEDVYSLAAMRCATIDADVLETIQSGESHKIGFFEAEMSGGLLRASVPQPVQFVRAAGSAYRHAVERYKAFLAGTTLEKHHASFTYRAAQQFEDQAEQSTITQAARAVEGVVDDPTVWDFLNKERLEATLEEWEQKKADLREPVEQLGETLYDTMMAFPAYQQAREDLTAFVEEAGGAEALSEKKFKTFVDRLGIEERLLADAEYSAAGRAYLAEQLGQYVAADPERGIEEQGEKTWYDRVPYDLGTVRRLSSVAANALEAEVQSEFEESSDKAKEALDHKKKAKQLLDTYENKAARISALSDEIESTRSQLATWQKAERYITTLAGKLGVTPSGGPQGPAPSTGHDGLNALIRKAHSGVEGMATYIHEKVGAGKKAEKLYELKGKRVESAKEARQISKSREASLQKYEQKMRSSSQHGQRADLYEAGRARVGRLALSIDGLHLFFLANTYRKTAKQGASIDRLAQIGIGTAETVASIRHLSGISSAVKNELYRLHTAVGVVEVFYFVGHAIQEYSLEEDSDTGAALGHLTSALGVAILIIGSGFVAGVISFAVVFLGQLMVAVFGDTELEEWFKACVWAKEGYSGHLPRDKFGEKRLTNELNGLFEILTRPRVRVMLDVSEDWRLRSVRLRVEPRLFQPGLMELSSVSLSLESSFLAFWTEEHLDKEISGLDSAEQVVRANDDTLRSATWRWDGQTVSDRGEVAMDKVSRSTLDFDVVEATVALEIDYRAVQTAEIRPRFEYSGVPAIEIGSAEPRDSVGILQSVYS